MACAKNGARHRTHTCSFVPPAPIQTTLSAPHLCSTHLPPPDVQLSPVKCAIEAATDVACGADYTLWIVGESVGAVSLGFLTAGL